jgi:ABC-type multidrug transport system permease subunit
MRQIFEIGHNDIRLFLRSKAGYVWLFVVPLVFVYFMGMAFRSAGGDPANPRPSVLLENLDTHFLGAALVTELDAQGMDLIGQEKRNEAERGIRIPGDFTQKVLSRARTKVTLFELEGSGAEAGFLIELRLLRAILAMNSHLIEWVARSDSQNPIDDAGLQRIMAAPNPVALKTRFAGREPVPSGFNQSLPGTLVMFLMMNLLIFGGASIAGERRNGVLRRLAVYPIRKWELVVGKVYGRFLLGCVQIVFFLLLGRFVFGVNIGHNIGVLLLTLCLYAWVAASLGVLIGSLVVNEDKTIGLCVLASMVMAALGGCWWPMEVVPETMKLLGHLFPTAWAMDSLHQLISFGGGLATVWVPLGVLTVFAVMANAGAAKALRY